MSPLQQWVSVFLYASTFSSWASRRENYQHCPGTFWLTLLCSTRHKNVRKLPAFVGGRTRQLTDHVSYVLNISLSLPHYNQYLNNFISCRNHISLGYQIWSISRSVNAVQIGLLEKGETSSLPSWHKLIKWTRLDEKMADIRTSC